MLTVLENEEKTSEDESPLDGTILESGERLPETSTNLTVVALEVLINVA